MLSCVPIFGGYTASGTHECMYTMTTTSYLSGQLSNMYVYCLHIQNQVAGL